MTFQPAGSGSLVAFLVIVAVVAAAKIAAVYVGNTKEAGAAVARRRALVFAACYAALLVAVAVATSVGVVAAAPMPRLPITFAVFLVIAVGAGLSPVAAPVAKYLPLAALVGFQSFRLPLELVLHDWAVTGTIPTTMTWTGENFDIISGVAALVLAPFAAKSRAAAWSANVIGLVLLANVVRVVAMSSPLPFAWGIEPPLQLAFHLPYVLIAPVCVGGALAGHVVLTRRLLKWKIP